MASKDNTDVMDGVETAKSIAVIAPAMQGVMIGGARFNIKKQVNLPTLKQESGETIAVRFDTPIREEPQYKDVIVNNEDGSKGVVKQETFINIVRVTELGSGQPFEYVCNAMTADNIRSTYPDENYVGRSFAIQKLGTVAGKQYKQTNVVEIEAAE